MASGSGLACEARRQGSLPTGLPRGGGRARAPARLLVAGRLADPGRLLRQHRLLQPALDVLGRLGLAEQEALHDPAAEPVQDLHLAQVLDALRDHAQAERAGQGDDRGDHGRALRRLRGRAKLRSSSLADRRGVISERRVPCRSRHRISTPISSAVQRRITLPVFIRPASVISISMTCAARRTWSLRCGLLSGRCARTGGSAFCAIDSAKRSCLPDPRGLAVSRIAHSLIG